MKKFILGISPRYNFEGQNFVRVASYYIEAVQRDNIIPFIIVKSPNLKDTLALCDGFLVIGGNDIDPKYYHENNDLFLSQEINNELDEIDKAIVEYAYENNKPMMGICRGIQAITTFLGGTLYQDLHYNGIKHPLIEEHKHYIDKVENYGIAQKLPNHFLINSYHHQAVKDVPKDFKILYKNADTIEMIESTTKPILAVQWHPEKMIEDENSQIIFNYFFDMFK